MSQCLLRQDVYGRQGMQMGGRLQLFVLYDRTDEKLAGQLKLRLALLERQGLLSCFDPHDLPAGAEVQAEIERVAEKTELFVPLVSAELLASSAHHKLIEQALQRQKEGRTLVVPVLARAISWEHSVLAPLVVLPKNGAPVSTWRDRDQAWVEVAAGICDAARRWAEARGGPTIQEPAQAAAKLGAANIWRGKLLRGEFDAFFAYNNRDKVQVLAIGKALNARGINPWIDEESCRPGTPHQKVITEAILRIPCGCIFLGMHGLGRWQAMELGGLIELYANQQRLVIPILLPGVDQLAEEQIFLGQLTQVKFRSPLDEEALDNLEWGITGEHPRRRWARTRPTYEIAEVDAESARHLVRMAARSSGHREAALDLLLSRSRQGEAAERYWCYIALGLLGGNEAVAVLESAQQEDPDALARQGANEGFKVLTGSQGPG